jgi:NAD(P)-dependent dehydrogenase (short-subunit alcohol dehydrogenase family)
MGYLEVANGFAGEDYHQMEQWSRFAGKVSLVAGGTGALGRAVSLAFLEEGATVVVTYRGSKALDALVQAAGRSRGRLEAHGVDATDEAATRRLVEDLVAQHRRLDILVNTVGGYAGAVKLWELDSSVLDRMLALNLRSAYALSRAVLPALLRQGSGCIVNIAAKAAVAPPAGAAAYAASKAAAVAMMASLAADTAGTGVRVNSVLPRIIDTAANRKAMPHADFSKWPKAEQIARVILFLCSDEASVIHGASIPV